LGTGAAKKKEYLDALIDGGFIENAHNFGIPAITCLELHIPSHTGPNFDEEIRISIDWVKQNLPHVRLS